MVALLLHKYKYSAVLIYFPTPLVHSVLISRLLFEDSDSGLFSVTLFRKAVDDFKHKARENK